LGWYCDNHEGEHAMKTIQVEGLINTGALDWRELPDETAELPGRISKVLEMANQKGLDAVVVYGDREHFSNLEYLTKYDPRFEEALLVLIPGEIPKLIVALEGKDYSRIIPYEIKRYVHTGFGLEGQPGDGTRLEDILRDCGISNGMKIGVSGWKAFEDSTLIDIPYYMACALQEITGEKLVNVCDIFTSNEYGLRNVMSVSEIIQSEIMNTIASRQVYSAICGLQEGYSEMEAAQAFGIGAQPMMTYPAMSFGERNVGLGLASATYNRFLRVGDIVSVGIGYRFAMIHRSSFFVEGNQQLNQYTEGKGEQFYEQYFQLVTKWYESLAIHKTGGEVYRAIGTLKDGMGIVLNMGHQIHTNEWINSLFFEGSNDQMKSGMALQCDIIAGNDSPFMSAHIEDGLILADCDLRDEIQEIAPKAYGRMIKRREFMRDVLKIDVSDEILPTSDIQGMMFPYMQNPRIIAVNV
jgi:hypothetical protein